MGGGRNQPGGGRGLPGPFGPPGGGPPAGGPGAGGGAGGGPGGGKLGGNAPPEFNGDCSYAMTFMNKFNLYDWPIWTRNK
jgi:hypothetical protein